MFLQRQQYSCSCFEYRETEDAHIVGATDQTSLTSNGDRNSQFRSKATHIESTVAIDSQATPGRVEMRIPAGAGTRHRLVKRPSSHSFQLRTRHCILHILDSLHIVGQGTWWRRNRPDQAIDLRSRVRILLEMRCLQIALTC